MNLHSYPKIWNMGHGALSNLPLGDIIVQEKVDGSQFSFGIVDGKLMMRSKRAPLFEDTGGKLFGPAIAHVASLFGQGHLVEGWTYRAEAMCRPKHNSLAYDTAPKNGMILYDIDTGLETRMGHEELAAWADRLDLLCVPTYYEGPMLPTEDLIKHFETPSILGGSIEGIVIKNYNQWGSDGKQLMAKLVQDEFRELNNKTHAKPGRGDIINGLIDELSNEARWQKAAQHLNEEGQLAKEPRDIGKIMKEVQIDLEAECEELIKDRLWNHFRKDILRGSTRGIPNWYKSVLRGD